MDATQISAGIVALCTLATGAVTALSASGKRSRARSRQQGLDLEDATAYIIRGRRDRHRHNDEHHPDGRGAIDVPPLPDYLLRGDDA